MEEITVHGAKIPAIGLGTWELQGPGARKAVSGAIGLGYRHIDTAEMYGNEEEVGQGIKDSGINRSDIFLTTKVWADNIGEGDLQQHARASLQRLKVDYVDLLLIHWPNARIPLNESINALMDVQSTGMALHIGVSNFPVALMKQAVEDCGAKLICNQVEYHPYLNQNAVLNYARTHNMAVTAYCPLARGGVADDDVILDIAAKYKKSPGQITLRWLTQQQNVAAIPKAASEKHQRENLEIFDFRLSADEMKSIHALARPDGRIVVPSAAPAWDKAA